MASRYRRLLLPSLLIILALILFTLIRFQTDLYEIKLPDFGGDKDVKSPSAPIPLVPSNTHSTPNIFPTSQPESGNTPTNTTGDLPALKALCRETQWTSGLWIHCHSTCGSAKTSVCGGLNNARNRIQTCIRYAIDAGAGIIIPSAVTRSETHLKDTNGGRTVCPDFFWNMESLKTTMEESCPQMGLRFCDDRAGIGRVINAPHRGFDDASHYKDTFRNMVMGILTQKNVMASSMVDRPVLINFADSLMGWSYSKSDELFTVRKDLYRVLNFKQDLLNMSYELLAHNELSGGEFIGVHLRGESDWPDDFGTAKDQMNLYKEEIERIKVTTATKTVYVSSGDENVIQTFRDMLRPHGFTVHDKWTLLTGNQTMLDRINALPFDQKGILEYEILVNSKFFLGPAMSSMTSLIAYQRSIEEKEDIFTTHIFPGSTRNEVTKQRIYPTTPAMLGDARTKLMVVDNFDIMDNFP